MAETVPLLGYAVCRRRRWRRSILPGIVLLVVIAAGRRYAPANMSRVQILWLQHECLSYEPPPAAVSGGGGGAAENARTSCASRMSALANRISQGSSGVWGSGGLMSPNTDCAFLGRLRNRHGDRIVVVRFDCSNYEGGDSTLFQPPKFTAWVFPPAGLVGAGLKPQPGLECSMTSVVPFPDLVRSEVTKVPELITGAGLRDGFDPSSFVIHYAVDGTPGDLRGTLGDDDRIYLRDLSANGLWGWWYVRQPQDDWIP